MRLSEIDNYEINLLGTFCCPDEQRGMDGKTCEDCPFCKGLAITQGRHVEIVCDYNIEHIKGMKKLKITSALNSFCPLDDSDNPNYGNCSECEYNCGFCHNAEGVLCVECGYNKELTLKHKSNEGTGKTNGR